MCTSPICVQIICGEKNLQCKNCSRGYPDKKGTRPFHHLKNMSFPMEKNTSQILKDTNFYLEARNISRGLKGLEYCKLQTSQSNFRSCNDTMMNNLQIPLSRIYVLNKRLFRELIQKNISISNSSYRSYFPRQTINQTLA